MADGSIVPISLSGYNNYIRRTYARLIENNPATSNPYGQDYGLSTIQVAAWQGFRDADVNTLWPDYDNPLTKNKVTRQNLVNSRNSFATFAELPLQTIAASGISGPAEEAIFNFHIGHGTPTTTHTPIPFQCLARMTAEGNGLYDILCRFAEDASRAGRPPHCDAVQQAFFIGDKDTDLTSPDDARLTKGLSSHAHYHHDFGGANMAKWLFIFFRWYNTKHPDLAGPWSPLHKLAIA